MKVSLDDKYSLDKGRAFMTGIEALVRLPILQHQRDLERGLDTGPVFACERTAMIRGFVAVIGSMPYNVARRRSRCGKEPVSVLMINGTADPIVPWDGGNVTFEDQALGRVIPVERAFGFWRRHNQQPSNS